MRFYWAYFKLKFITGLQYRASAIAGLSTQFFFGLINILVYIAFYESSKTTATPINLNALATYIWLNQAFYALIFVLYKDAEIIKMIKDGNLAYELVRPKNLYFMWYFKIYSERMAMVTLRCVPVILITILVPAPYGLSLPISSSAFLLAVLTLIIGSILVTAIITLYHVILMWTLDEKGIVNVFATAASILSGVVVPIPFFPKTLRTITNCLPFRYVSDLPFRIYSGDIPLDEGLQGLIIQFIWIFIIIIVGYILSEKALKKAVIQGG